MSLIGLKGIGPMSQIDQISLIGDWPNEPD